MSQITLVQIKLKTNIEDEQYFLKYTVYKIIYNLEYLKISTIINFTDPTIFKLFSGQNFQSLIHTALFKPIFEKLSALAVYIFDMNVQILLGKYACCHLTLYITCPGSFMTCTAWRPLQLH